MSSFRRNSCGRFRLKFRTATLALRHWHHAMHVYTQIWKYHNIASGRVSHTNTTTNCTSFICSRQFPIQNPNGKVHRHKCAMNTTYCNISREEQKLGKYNLTVYPKTTQQKYICISVIPIQFPNIS